MGPNPLNHLAPNPHYSSSHKIQNPHLPSSLFPRSILPLTSIIFAPQLSPSAPSTLQFRPAVSYMRWSLQWLMQEGDGDPASISNLQPSVVLKLTRSTAILVSVYCCFCICAAVIYSWKHVNNTLASRVQWNIGNCPAKHHVFGTFSVVIKAWYMDKLPGVNCLTVYHIYKDCYFV